MAVARSAQPLVSREQLLAALLIVTSANGIVPLAVAAARQAGFWDGLANTFGISAIVWAAWIAGCTIVLQADGTTPPRRTDYIVTALAAPFVFAPVLSLSWPCLTAIAAYVFLTADRDSALRRAAPIFAAIAVPMCWGPLFLRFAAYPVLDIDAILVGTITGAPHSGNVIQYADSRFVLQIFDGCSSFHNISQALVAWVATNRALGQSWHWKDTAGCALAVAAAIAVNLGRLSFMALAPANYELLHGPLGDRIAGTLTLVLIILVCAVGHRRELFARA